MPKIATPYQSGNNSVHCLYKLDKQNHSFKIRLPLLPLQKILLTYKSQKLLCTVLKRIVIYNGQKYLIVQIRHKRHNLSLTAMKRFSVFFLFAFLLLLIFVMANSDPGLTTRKARQRLRLHTNPLENPLFRTILQNLILVATVLALLYAMSW